MLLRVLILLILTAITPLASANEHGIAVSVGGSPITATDIKERSNLIIFSASLPNDKNSYSLVRDKVIEILIDEHLIEKEAKRLEIEVDDSEIEESFFTLAERNNIPKKQFSAFLKSKQIAEKELKKQIRHQMLWSKIIASQVQTNISVTDKEIAESRAGIEKAAKSAAEIAELKLAEIVLLYRKESDVEKNKIFAQKLITQIKQGANFGELAREFSQAQSASSYGEIGWIASNQIQQEIARKLMRLSKGEIDSMVLPDGVHIFKLLDKKVISSLEQTLGEQDIRNLLTDRKLDIAIKAYFRKMRKNTHIQFYSK